MGRWTEWTEKADMEGDQCEEAEEIKDEEA